MEINDNETYQVIGAAMEVHRHLGSGFSESVYADALEVEFQMRGIPYEREKMLSVYYKNTMLQHYYIPDYICFGHVIVELKATESILPVYESQIINYLKVAKFRRGLLINFGEMSLRTKRYVNDSVLI